jgi:hypothetical protein
MVQMRLIQKEQLIAGTRPALYKSSMLPWVPASMARRAAARSLGPGVHDDSAGCTGPIGIEADADAAGDEAEAADDAGHHEERQEGQEGASPWRCSLEAAMKSIF